MKFVARNAILAAAMMSGAATTNLAAQVCHGTPNGGGVAYELGSLPFAESSHGASLALGSSKVFGANFRMNDMGNDVSVMNGGVRFSLVFGKSALKICPGVGLGFQQESADPDPNVSVTGTTLAGRGHLGVGYEVPEYRGIGLIPFLVGTYQLAATRFQLDDGDAEVDDAGDVRSSFDVEFGGIARYKMVYLGWVQNLDVENGPYMGRLIVGFAFGKSGN
jgi:hypothetical protein